MRYLPKEKDNVLIIGSGIGGLSMAIILAKLGFGVTVIEKNSRPGGMLRSYRRQGIHCNVGVHYLGALGKGQILRRLFDFLGITDDLSLDPMGVNAPVDRYYFSDGFAGPGQFDMPVGLNAYEERLKQSFPKEEDAIDGFMLLLRQSAKELDRVEFLFGRPSASNLIDQTEPLWAVLDRLHCSPALKCVMSIPSVWFGVPPAQCPQFLHTMTLASYLASAWRLKNHGLQMVEVLVRRLTELGGRIVCGHAVRQINTDEGRVTGLTLENEAHYNAPLVVASAHPMIVLNMLDGKDVKPSYRRRIMGLVNTGGMFAVNATVPSGKHTALPYNTFSIETDAGGNINDVIYTQLRVSEKPDALVLSLVTRGYDERWRPWHNTTSGHRGEDYTAAKMALAHALIKKITPIIGPLDDLNIIDTFTPLTIRDWVNSPNGSAYGVMRSTEQIFSASLLNRTKVKGLYLTGQSVMAPGILGGILGSLVTAKFMVGPERFQREVQLL
jgi:phytoene dehydrogenase-like protein